ncbi:hypothetical protein [Chitinophaga pinensis]|uniref:Uncharacterized protein n=1 Tax=Chitinophaga pinensis (strain ATCC 43595 / DSM 2588 / LMG 13176 / NBRC 15968 / NCIMB 11800 / UQM 2034) TaxID=485918 RepID=A0A979G5M2_CHIPD|nr:hypothetical protein [Chitinophaga pinensis]ACU61305.1 hypothetical protein Cpin_3843 [Chitinophaga pinensis DSM 2588]
MNREPGYYWVKLQPNDKEMHVAKWTGKYWLLHGETFTISDRSFHEINPRRLTTEASVKRAFSAHLDSSIDIGALQVAIVAAAVSICIYFIFS